MSDAFSEREKGFEAKFRLDQELEFKINARRDKLFGLWAAEAMGMAGGGAESYARSVVAADLEEKGDDDIIRKVLRDLQQHEVDITEGRLRIKLDKFHAEARRQMMSEIESGQENS